MKSNDAPAQDTSMNLYDFNQILMAQMKPLTDEAIQKAIQQINDFKKPDSIYYMLLCRDINYYTVFAVKSFAVEDFGSVVIDCARNAGNKDILSVELNDEKTAIEIWINTICKSHNNIDPPIKVPRCMLLFNYDFGVCYVK